MHLKQPTPLTPGGWVPSPWFLAQSAHAGWAAAVVAFVAALSGAPSWAVLGIVVFASFKEFVADRTFLEHDTLAGSTADFAFYLAGALGCWLALTYLLLGIPALVLIVTGAAIWDYEKQQPEGL